MYVDSCGLLLNLEDLCCKKTLFSDRNHKTRDPVIADPVLQISFNEPVHSPSLSSFLICGKHRMEVALIFCSGINIYICHIMISYNSSVKQE